MQRGNPKSFVFLISFLIAGINSNRATPQNGLHPDWNGG